MGESIMKKILSLTAAAALAMPTFAAASGQRSTADAATLPVYQLTEDEGDYIFNSTFEGSEDGWTGRGAASVSSGSKYAFEGSGSLFVEGRTDSWNGATVALGPEFVPGSTYSFSANVMYDTGKDSDIFHLTLQYNDANGDAHYDKVATVKPMKGKWVQLANTEFTIPAGAEDLYLYVETDKSTIDFYVDDVKAAVGGTYLSGATGGQLIPADVNFDGVVNSLDMIAARRGLINGLDDAATLAADVDKSKTFEVNDVVLIQEFLLGRIDEFPDNSPEPDPGEFTDFDYDPNLQYRESPRGYLDECPQAGTVTKEYYNGIRGNKALNVYTPYGYDPAKKYNIFYLMHGGGENEDTIFSGDVHLQRILDHMIMNGDLEPLIVVTPTFNGNGSEAQNFYEEFRQSVIPFVEGKYSTYAESTDPEGIEASRMHRAYGGFSMGAVSTWAVMQNDLDCVGYFMPLSGDHWSGNSAQDKAKSITDAIDRSGYNKRQYFILAATGSDDIAYPNIQPQIEAMKPMSQFDYTSDFSQGNFYFMVAPGLTHWWGYVRHYVYDALPYFFHESGNS